ncbi:uncharacterized acetyltransferase At3g50280-like [Lolium perenne]|uniref:uncharacterized acetyltransferase At3g50280-like n=1 Tax=Lolium perenne TaxID=4522 RepID=UPI0021EA3971|nr:uncharacterized acetyltransferase At3g50280-like [Lolium perenne]
MQTETGACPVRVVSRRMIQPPSEEPVRDIHLTPWDLRLISTDYIQKGILLPKPPAGVAGQRLVDALASSFALALARFYPFAGRLAVEHHDGGKTIAVLLRCTGEGAEFIHAAAPGVTVADITGSLRIPPVVRAFFSLNHVLDADAAADAESPPLPVLSAQVTVLADGVFVGMSLNHSVGDGTAFWEFFNTWSEIHRGGEMASTTRPAPLVQRFFLDACPVPVRMPFGELRDVVRRFERPMVEECFFTFSAASIRKLKARANDEIMAAATVSSLQAVLAHLWRAVSRARRLPPGQETSYTLVIGCRGRVDSLPAQGYMGNAVAFGKASCTAGEILDKGLGWTAWQLNRVVASFDEASVEEWLDRWTREPDFFYVGNLSSGGDSLTTGSSPRFDVFGNDFGWGKPVAVRSGAGNKIDGKATVFEGPERGGSMSLEVCIAPAALERLLGDEEFMDSVSMPM